MFGSYKRKARERVRSLENLKRLGLPIAELPDLPGVDRTSMRDARAISIRTIILGVFGYLSQYPEDLQDMRKFLFEDSNLGEFLSGQERELMELAELSQERVVEISWCTEGFYTLMWVLGIVDEMCDPNVQAEISELQDMVPPTGAVEVFKSSIRLVSQDEMHKALDFYYLASWFARRHQLGLNAQVVWARRKALEWAADGTLEDWDDIPMDT